MFKRILLSYDGSDHSKNALRTAVGLAKAFDAEIHLSHSPQEETPPIVIGSFVSVLATPPTHEQIAEAGQHVADEARKLIEAEGGAFTEVHIGRGNPAQHTLEAAREIDADLIVMGRRGLGSVGALALGSVSLAISHGADCACLTVV